MDVNSLNRSGESPLHIASRMGMAHVVKKLLEAGANPTLQTPPIASSSSFSPSASVVTNLPKKVDASTNPFDDDDEINDEEPTSESKATEDLGLLTPLHLAVTSGFEEVVLAFVEYAEYFSVSK